MLGSFRLLACVRGWLIPALAWMLVIFSNLASAPEEQPVLVLLTVVSAFLQPEERQIVVGICAMTKKSNSKPMTEILERLCKFDYIDVVVFPEEVILEEPVEAWPLCDCLISFHSKGRNQLLELHPSTDPQLLLGASLGKEGLLAQLALLTGI